MLVCYSAKLRAIVHNMFAIINQLFINFKQFLPVSQLAIVMFVF
jgi:hypothetical protein